MQRLRWARERAGEFRQAEARALEQRAHQVCQIGLLGLAPGRGQMLDKTEHLGVSWHIGDSAQWWVEAPVCPESPFLSSCRSPSVPPPVSPLPGHKVGYRKLRFHWVPLKVLRAERDAERRAC